MGVRRTAFSVASVMVVGKEGRSKEGRSTGNMQQASSVSLVQEFDRAILLIGLLTLAATYVVMGYAWLNVPNSDELVYLIILASLDASSSFFAALFGAIFLKEYLSCAVILFVFLGFVGIVLVFEPLELLGLSQVEGNNSSSLNPMEVFASLVVLLGSAGQGLQSVLQRGWKWSVWLGICTAGLTGMIFTLAIDHFIMTDRDSCWEWVREESSTSPLTTFAWGLILCLTSFNKSLCMNYVLKEASSGVSAGTMQTVHTCAVVAFQVCLQILFFDVEMSACSWVGVAVILISCVGIVHSEAMQNQAKADASAYEPIQDYKDFAHVTPRSSTSQISTHRTSKSVRFSGVYTQRSDDRKTPRLKAQCGL